VLVDNGPLLNIGIWFVGAAAGHGAVLYPLYAITDIAAHNRLLRRHRPAPSPARVPWINHLRVPVALSGCSCWSGSRSSSADVTTRSPARRACHTNVYLGRWLGMLFLGSSALYALRLCLASKADRASAPTNAS
jgi:hypothetical protein